MLTFILFAVVFLAVAIPFVLAGQRVRRMGMAIILSVLTVGATTQMVGCTPAQVSEFNTVLNEVGPAVSTILQIVAIFSGSPANVSLATKIGADATAIETLYKSYQSAAAADQPGIEGDISAAFTTLNADLTTVFSVAQVSDKNTQAKVTALIGLVESAVQIAEGLVPSASAAKAPAPNLTASDLVDSYNKILVAKTGNAKVDAFTRRHKIHIHSAFVRYVTLGHAR